MEKKMRNVIINIAMSLDGFIADKNGGVGFLEGDGTDPNNLENFNNFFNGVESVLMGYKTYHQVTTELAPDNYPYKGKRSFVFTHKKMEDQEEIFFVSDNLKELILQLKADEKEGDIWICGGATLVNQAIALGLVDEIIVSIIPTILGEGTRLFDRFDKEIRLKLISTHSANGISDLKYSIINQFK